MVNRTNRYRNGASMQNTPERTMNRNSRCNCNQTIVPELMNRLRKVDFAIVDTVLYLDAYPNCKAAMENYKKLIPEREMLMQKLAELGKPMTCYENFSDTWEWINSPWPWEYEANV